MCEPTARERALSALNAYRRAETDLDFAEVSAQALVAIALHLTEGQPFTTELFSEPKLDHWPTAAELIAAAEAKKSAEARQPTGLNRLAVGDPAAGLTLPQTWTVDAVEWCVKNHETGREYFVCLTEDDEFMIGSDKADSWDAPICVTLAEAVAAILARGRPVSAQVKFVAVSAALAATFWVLVWPALRALGLMP